MAKSIKVKSLADKYSGATSTGVVEVLQELGINNVPISGTVPAEETKRVEAHLAKIFGPPKSRSKKETKAAPKEAERAKVKKTEPKSDKKMIKTILFCKKSNLTVKKEFKNSIKRSKKNINTKFDR